MNVIASSKAGIINRIKGMLVSPKTEWLVVATENQTMPSLITSYVVPLAVLGAAASFLGYAFFWKFGSVSWGIYYAISILITSIVSVLVSSFVVDALAPTFGSEKNINRSAQLVVYAYTPSFVGAVLNIFPPLAIIGSLLGLYGIYLWYLGLGPIKKTPEDKKVGYLIVSIIVLIVVYMVIGFVFAKVFLGMFGLSVVAAV